MVKHFTPAQQYWSQLESPFRKFLVDLVVDRQMNDDGDIVYGEVRLPEWYGRLRTAALSAFADAVLPVQGSHRTYKAAALADARFQRLLSYILG
ncbi:MAG: hypothetical protein NTZ05_06990 [Chloroflexi bacterium]|nr:hypothetical protein [Chloroflexota bacterium]